MRLPDLFSVLFKGKVPGQLVVQFTDACNAACPQCAMRVTNRFKRSRLPLDYVKRIIDAAAEKGVKAISFTGGEPLLFLDDLISMINHAGEAGIPYIRTGTNGFLFRCRGRDDNFKYRMAKLGEKLAATKLRNFWISLDSADGNLHEQLRGLEGILTGIEQTLPIFHKQGLFPSANLGINRMTGGQDLDLFLRKNTKAAEQKFYADFKRAFSRFYTSVINMGFTIANVCYPMSLCDESKAVYPACSTDRIVNFSKKEKAILFKSLLHTIPAFRSKIRIFSPTASLYSLNKNYTNEFSRMIPCLGGIDFFFVDAGDGNTYPCGYRADDNLGKLWDLNPKHIDRSAKCTLCDWECFRDPSELFFPLTATVLKPSALFEKVLKDPLFFKFWFGDLLYYRACGYFNGRANMDTVRLKRFAQSQKE